jgi:DNA-binding LytR/AlgR family response regulator
MKVLIIEDEVPAQIQLERLICMYYPDFDIVGKISSVKAAVEWLNTQNADLIFMDVELSDGLCFDIFTRVTIKAAVIITTAYDIYAIKAFKTNCVDYLLKPIGKDDFVNAIEKCRGWTERHSVQGFDIAALKQMLSWDSYKQRFTIKVGDRIIVLNTADIAYFYSEYKGTSMVTHENKKYLTDLTLDAIEGQIDPTAFFRLTRGCITNIKAIREVSKYSNSRLKVSLQPAYGDELLVSRVRMSQFLDWLEGK